MPDLRAFCCWLPGQADLGRGYTLASSADRARACLARSAADVGLLPRASPHLVRCRRVPEYDRNPALEEGWCSTEDHVRLGAAVAEVEGGSRRLCYDRFKLSDEPVGTNYYLLKGGTDPCPTCGHAEPPISEHIGKSSAGWCFSLHAGPFEDSETGQESYRDLEDWKAEWSKPGVRIEDEYGRAVEPDEMYRVIAERGTRAQGPTDKEGWPKDWWKSAFSRYKSEEDFHQNNHSRRGPDGLLRHRADGRHCIGRGSGTWDMIAGEFS